MNRLTSLSLAAALVFVTIGCSNRGGETAPRESSPTASTEVSSETTEPTASLAVMFGDLESPCGPAIDGIAPVVTADENGGHPARANCSRDHWLAP